MRITKQKQDFYFENFVYFQIGKFWINKDDYNIRITILKWNFDFKFKKKNKIK